MSDEERPRRTWREIDQARSRSTHRREERPPPGSPRPNQRSQKSYRAALDRLFTTGKIAELVEQKAPGGTPGERTTDDGENPLKLLAAIEKATDRDALSREVDLYLEKCGTLPADLELLGRVLEHRNPDRQRDAMEHIETLLQQEKPKRSRAMVGQLKLIRDTSLEEELVVLARRLLEKLT